MSERGRRGDSPPPSSLALRKVDANQVQQGEVAAIGDHCTSYSCQVSVVCPVSVPKSRNSPQICFEQCVIKSSFERASD